MADAAYAILGSTGRSITGQLLLDDQVLSKIGVTDFETYRYDGSKEELMVDLFVD